MLTACSARPSCTARAADTVAPQTRALGTLLDGYGHDGQEQRAQVPMIAGRCYHIVSAGSSSMRALYSYLWDPRGKRVATQKRDRQTVITHCARFSGSHLFLVKPAGGDGRFRSVLYGP